MKRTLRILLVVTMLAACRETTFEVPPGCRVSSQQAADLAAPVLEQMGLDWGDPISISFNGSSFRLVYQTPSGQPQRAVIVDCTTGQVTVS